MIGVIGKKIGMTQIFNKHGHAIPVTIIKIQKNIITQIKNIKKEGYNAVQITTGKKKLKKLKKPEIGHYLKTKTNSGCILREFKLKNNNNYILGQEITIDIFENIKKVNIIGISKGKGFSGTIKRWNFHSQDSSHGNSLSHRTPGSIGQNQTPGKVFKGKKMPGQLGNKKITIKNISTIKIYKEMNLLLIKGSVPGAKNSNLIIKPS